MYQCERRWPVVWLKKSATSKPILVADTQEQEQNEGATAQQAVGSRQAHPSHVELACLTNETSSERVALLAYGAPELKQLPLTAAEVILMHAHVP
jgi:hypothetical protein